MPVLVVRGQMFMAMVYIVRPVCAILRWELVGKIVVLLVDPRHLSMSRDIAVLVPK
jgi:hypothetical protein